ncbi:MAG: VCBS repeat-containing protein [Chloroflexi bacterium]|nr:VCBS repeat-containing protein [Chloroflexota bacterium]
MRKNNERWIRDRLRRIRKIAGVWAVLSVVFALSAVTVFADPVQPTGKLDLPGVAAIIHSPPTLVDIDGDGDQEILVGTSDGKVIAINRSGNTITQMWSYSTGSVLGGKTAIRGAISAADLDRNGTVEIVVPVGDVFNTDTFGGLVVLDANGNLLWYYRTYDHTGQQLKPDGKSDAVLGAAALGDLDNDGDLEIVLGSVDHRVYVFHHDGTIAPGWPQMVRDTVWTSPALADLNNDGLLEIIFGIDTHAEGHPFNTQDGGALQVYRADGTLIWEKLINQVIYSSPAVGDLDGNGTLEIMHGTGDFFRSAEGLAAGYKVYAWDANGNSIWTANTGNFPFGSLALGNIDGDPQLEVVANVLDHKTYAWNHDGSGVWSQTPTNFQGNTMELRGSPIIADFTGDGMGDVFANTFWDAAILNGPEGNQLTETFFPGDSKPGYVSGWTTANNAPALGDLNGDGTLELVLASASTESRGNTAQIVFWDSVIAKGAAAPWPMFGQNPQHTNLYPHVYALNSEVISHTIPAVMVPGETRQVSIAFKNAGTDTWSSSSRSGAAQNIALKAVGGSDPFTSNTTVSLGTSVQVGPDQPHIFSFSLTAPVTEGYYTTDWRVQADGAGTGFGRTVQVEVKVSNQPALHVLTTQGFKAGGLATQPLPGTSSPPSTPYTNWSAAQVLKLTADKRGYYLLDRFGGFWYGGNNFPLPSLPADKQSNLIEMVLGPNHITYYVLRNDGTIFGCNADSCDLSFNPAPATGIQARSMALAVTTDPKLAKEATGVYVVDGFGNLYTDGSAPALYLPSGLPVAQDIVIRIKLIADGKGFYLLDKYGRVWNGGAAPALSLNYSPKIGEDWARDFELTADEKGFYMLDRDGAIYSGGTAPALTVNIPATGPGIGRDLELVDSRQSSAPSAAFAPDGVGRFYVNGTAGPIQATIPLSNQGTSAFQWTASAVWPTQAQAPAVTITPDTGTLNPGASQPLVVEVSDLTGVSNGTYPVDISITATGATGGSPVNFETKLTVYVVDHVYSVNLAQISR